MDPIDEPMEDDSDEREPERADALGCDAVRASFVLRGIRISVVVGVLLLLLLPLNAEK